ncbi:BspA family leucine-rich repeat surface protein [Xylocopilactobacillus apicola]|uniref:BspA family leucine-rich repeat surface protein n=1 Tax=Xylocopilactobacillus apicola TaxID=2932184 RepID=A0AAU9DRW5_9LACO|nr:BspA family leucine-rich repeat surface protein [Xylocopilactobacillus apicola]BDR57923.1 hypothetical protein XA3_03640 [Xylocopilactobacillus apicola]
MSLNWDRVPNASDGYIVERTTDGYTWTIPPTNYGKHIKVLNVYPTNGGTRYNFLKSWMDQIDPTSGQPVSMGLIDVDEVALVDFNVNPDQYLKNSDGLYQYDGIFFGSADSNGGWQDYNDLTTTSQPKVAAFADTGRSIVLGHDTITTYEGPYMNHDNFGKFRSKLGLKFPREITADGNTYDGTTWPGTDRVKFVNDGILNQYPHYLDSTAIYSISKSHTVSQFFMYDSGATKWMEFSAGNSSFGGKTNYVLDSNGNKIGDNNWYLVTKNNYAMIQTGHTTGECTPDEAKIIANMLYYTSTLNTTTEGADYTVKDTVAPDLPTVNYTSQVGDLWNFNIGAIDRGPDYTYRVKANTDNGMKTSDEVKVPVSSGIKGYIYLLDTDPNGAPAVTKDPVTGNVTNINLTPTNGSQASLSLNVPDPAGKYLHVIAVDNANNVSAVKTVIVSELKWWEIDPITKVLTIFPHELNGANDTSGASVWPWHDQAADITKVVLKPGVTARGSLHNLFADLTSATSIEGIADLNTANVTDMNAMFAHCQSLTSLDVSRFDTANVTDMNSMFNYCTGLTSLNVSSFVTDHVTSMRGMFQACTGITELNLNNFNTGLVQDFSYMFNEMHELKKLNVTSFNTTSATDMTVMFAHMWVLPSLDISSFNTSNVTAMSSMFDGSPKLWHLVIGAGSQLLNNCGLTDPVEETVINDAGQSYYVTANQWREVGGGSLHDPMGTAKNAAQIIADSQTGIGKRIYVWDQMGTQRLSTTTGIDFGTHQAPRHSEEYVTSIQSFNISDNRNGRTGKLWRVEAAISKPFEHVLDSTKKIAGNPLYYHSGGSTTNLTSTAQSIYNGAAGSGYRDTLNIPWSLSFKMKRTDIPIPGQYQATVMYTLVNIP